MNPRYLLDTNVLSERLRPRPNARVLARMKAEQERIATASPVLHELRFGTLRMEPSRRRAALERYIEQVIRRTIPVLAYDAAAAEWHAGERACLARIGRLPPFVDGQIAAIAVTRGLILVTFNITDFQDFQGLHIDDWRA